MKNTMKKQIKKEKVKETIIKKDKKETNKKPKNIWKIVSMVFIVLFALIVIGGLVRLYHFKSAFKAPSTEELNLAKSVVLADVTSKGMNITIDEIKSSNKLMMFRDSQKRVIELSIAGSGINKNIYLVDLDLKQIVMHSQIEFYGWMNDPKFQQPFPSREGPRFERKAPIKLRDQKTPLADGMLGRSDDSPKENPLPANLPQQD